MLLAAEPDAAHAFLDDLVDLHMAALERFLAAVGPYIDVILFGDDLGMQSGPQIAPSMYREFFKPRHQRMWRRAHELADVKVMLHSCGGVREVLPDLIDAGLEPTRIVTSPGTLPCFSFISSTSCLISARMVFLISVPLIISAVIVLKLLSICILCDTWMII